MKNILFCLSFLIFGISCQNSETVKSPEPQKQTNKTQEVVVSEDSIFATKIPPVFRLDTIIDFDSIVSIQVRNDKGLHDLNPDKWDEIEYTVQQSIYIYGLLCQRQKNALIFTMLNGNEIEGYFCSGHINFSNSRIHGSFRLGSVIDIESL